MPFSAPIFTTLKYYVYIAYTKFHPNPAIGLLAYSHRRERGLTVGPRLHIMHSYFTS